MSICEATIKFLTSIINLLISIFTFKSTKEKDKSSSEKMSSHTKETT